ncbi:hypothetical protein M404DRAFT_996969 [Pisolithus tinctorius Marx 270]|uniref:Uncharacterized protein n=1 Tax=Pisolithus tinctorius Marx 270 TaxID=870435 RepID=A0A0C3JI28_PISTI|nr:hypothetical protein M404DRAFT_996969 [Pisolithus tinctorius Marx 270]
MLLRISELRLLDEYYPDFRALWKGGMAEASRGRSKARESYSRVLVKAAPLASLQASGRALILSPQN